MKTSLKTLKKYIGKFNNGVGHDGFHSQFLRHATHEFFVQMSLFMNACFNHCYIPVELLKGDINPIIKNTKGNSTDPANYRPVMLSSCLLKIF